MKLGVINPFVFYKAIKYKQKKLGTTNKIIVSKQMFYSYVMYIAMKSTINQYYRYIIIVAIIYNIAAGIQ